MTTINWQIYIGTVTTSLRKFQGAFKYLFVIPVIDFWIHLGNYIEHRKATLLVLCLVSLLGKEPTWWHKCNLRFTLLCFQLNPTLVLTMGHNNYNKSIRNLPPYPTTGLLIFKFMVNTRLVQKSHTYFKNLPRVNKPILKIKTFELIQWNRFN